MSKERDALIKIGSLFVGMDDTELNCRNTKIVDILIKAGVMEYDYDGMYMTTLKFVPAVPAPIRKFYTNTQGFKDTTMLVEVTDGKIYTINTEGIKREKEIGLWKNYEKDIQSYIEKGTWKEIPESEAEDMIILATLKDMQGKGQI